MKYLILGAGPAGLAFATALKNNNIDDFLVLEKENQPGGLCRSMEVDGAPLDIGGGHFIDIKRKKVLELLFSVMPEKEWNYYQRNSQINLYGTYINNPIEANIWQLPLEEQVAYLKSIAIAGCNIDMPKPEKFVEWINWKLGDKIAECYMLPYNKKMFGDNLDLLGTYWLEKLPNVSFEETLTSCLEKKAYGSQPAHSYFYYPKENGSGEVWNRLANELGSKIRYGIEAKELDVHRHVVNGTYEAQYIINTIPWTEFININGIDNELNGDIQQLKYTSVSVDYYSHDIETDAHWIYEPDETVSYHRILVRKNFCPGSKGYWTETNVNRIENCNSEFRYINKYAYPLNTINKPRAISQILAYMSKHCIYGLGRWGEWEHYNSDVVVERAVDLANKLLKGNT